VAASGTLALVVAHPDDDAFGWAGSVALHAADPDFRFVLIHAAAFGRVAGTGRPGFKRLLHRVLPQSVFDRLQRQRIGLGLPVFEPSKTYHGRGVPDEEIGLAVDCRSVAERVVAGILEHRSQLHVMTDQPINTESLRCIVSREWSAVIWPPRVASSRLLTDVFDDL
jgi:LmbE family N-acetylglucosaminyl deacetylase